MLNAAVIGLGWWGTTIVKSLEGSDKINVVRGVDINQDAPAAFCAERGLPFSSSFEDALNDPDVDAVIIATPHSLHEPMVLAAAAAGKNIFCEKPMALSGGGARKMMAACEENGLVMGIGHERRFEGAWEELKRMADAGELGEILHLELNSSYNNMAIKPPSGWRQDPVEAPAGAMTALGVHVTDLMLSIAGSVTEVYAHLNSRSDKFPNEDVLTVQFLFESGVTASLVNLAATPFYQRMSIFGDEAWAEAREISNVDIPDEALLTWRGMDMVIHTRTYPWDNSTVERNLHHWADAVAGTAEYRFTPGQRVQNAQILEAITESAASGKPVAIK